MFFHIILPHKISRMFRTSCTSLPLILHVIDAKIPSQHGPKLPSLHDLVEAVRSYQSAPDSLDWMYDAVRGIVSLSQLQDPTSTSTSPSSLTAENLGAVDSPTAELACHPSVHLRLALVMDADLKRSRTLSTRDLSAGIARLFSSDSVNRIRALLLSQAPHQQGQGQKHTPSAGAASRGVQSGSSNSDNNVTSTSRKQALLNWGQVDQSMIFAIELGLVPAEPAGGGGGDDDSDDSASAMSVGTDDEDNNNNNAALAGHGPGSAGLPHRGAAVDKMDWREIAGQAFAETGDNAERDVLGAFIFRDQLPGPEAGYHVVEEDGGHAGGADRDGETAREAGPELDDDDDDQLETADVVLGAVIA